MTITDLIQKLELLRGKYGDLEVFDAHYQSDPYVSVEVGSEKFSVDWNMPTGFIKIGSEP